jgi:hypothetical protein
MKKAIGVLMLGVGDVCFFPLLMKRSYVLNGKVEPVDNNGGGTDMFRIL